jgi:polysaccharide biosynthesis/export protein
MKCNFIRLAILCLFGLQMLAVAVAQNSENPQDAAKTAANPSNSVSNTAPAAAANSKADPKSDDYIIGNGDELAVNVWKEPEISRTVPVRPDGKITLPLVGEVAAAGMTPRNLEANLTKQLTSFVASPSVTVSVQTVHSQKFNIVGEVNRPGVYELNGPPMTVLDALALAGGLKDFAKSKKIYILRANQDGSQVRLPFNYNKVLKGEELQQNVVLQARDTIVVP